jgi:hypothetical protein
LREIRAWAINVVGFNFGGSGSSVTWEWGSCGSGFFASWCGFGVGCGCFGDVEAFAGRFCALGGWSCGGGL